MVRTLLVRGMLVGIVAGLLAFGLARIWGEPQVDRAIAFESAHEHGQMSAMPGMAPGAATEAEDEPELVSRGVQSGLGLLTGITVYGVTEETYNQVTRRPGTFPAFRRGLDLLLDNGIKVRLKAMAMRDLYDLLEKVIDRCRDAGNVITQIVLKNS